MRLNDDQKKRLADLFPGKVALDEPLKKHTSLRVGGPAEVLVMPETEDELCLLRQWIHQHKTPYHVIGLGTNLLATDKGVGGVVIALTKMNKMMYQQQKPQQHHVVAGAGVPMRACCAFAASKGLGGLNFAVGIPGTIGGGIIMNAGSDLGSMGDVIESITVLSPEGVRRTIGKETLDFSYRCLSWPRQEIGFSLSDAVVLNGCFSLFPADPEQLKQEAKTISAKRKKKQPVGSFSAGSFFKNPRPGKPAGMLIDQAGLKGLRIGGAQVSPKHANFLINTGDATASDFFSLIDLIQQKVYQDFHVRLELEVNIVQDKAYP